MLSSKLTTDAFAPTLAYGENPKEPVVTFSPSLKFPSDFNTCPKGTFPEFLTSHSFLDVALGNDKSGSLAFSFGFLKQPEVKGTIPEFRLGSFGTMNLGFDYTERQLLTGSVSINSKEFGNGWQAGVKADAAGDLLHGNLQHGSFLWTLKRTF